MKAVAIWHTLPQKQARVVLLCGAGYLVVAGVFLRHYLLWDSQWLLGLALLPLVALPSPRRTVSPLLLALAFLLLLLAGLYQITTLFYLGFLVAAWCGLQGTIGFTGVYPFLLLGIVSPVFSYMAQVWSFPVRLQLTKAAVGLLNWVYPAVEVAGNLILLNGKEFSVDPACAGLNMLSFSLMLAVFLMAHLHRSTRKPWPLPAIGLLLLLMLVLNVASNLLRILLLVLFQIGPANWMHDGLGILCLVLYAVVPFYFLAKHWSRRLSKLASWQEHGRAFSWKKPLLLNSVLLVSLVGAGLQVLQKKAPAKPAPIPMAGFEQEKLKDGIVKLTRDNGLVYLKPLQGFYSAEHNPMICWEGSGFQFQNITEETVGDTRVYTGTLQKQKEQLYTAWWMDNGHHQTIAQTDWRWRMFKGEPPFHLVNVTAATEAELQELVREMLRQPTVTRTQSLPWVSCFRATFLKTAQKQKLCPGF